MGLVARETWNGGAKTKASCGVVSSHSWLGLSERGLEGLVVRTIKRRWARKDLAKGMLGARHSTPTATTTVSRALGGLSIHQT